MLGNRTTAQDAEGNCQYIQKNETNYDNTNNQLVLEYRSI